MDLHSAQALWDVETAWLNTAQYGLAPRASARALTDAVAVWRHGRGGPEAWGAASVLAKERFGRLVGVAGSEVTQGASVSQLLGPAGLAVPDGARVLAPEGEFTSNLYPWSVHADRGVKVSTVPLGELAASIDSSTWLVTFSLVQSATGEIAPVEEILAAARRHGALVCVDATQAVGWLPVEADRFDALVCACYKWLMAPRGLSFGYFSPRLRDRMRPVSAGPNATADIAASFYSDEMRLSETASRFDISPNWFAAVGGAASLGTVLDIGVERIHDHDVAMANRFREGLGLPPGDSAIVSVGLPDAGERLRAAGVWVSERAGQARLAFHVYTTTEHVDRAVAALRRSGTGVS
ncbi:aminotransferase class V-fold PLP-dependent enzyme [Actinorugispora endophytica]|uniref:Selenocysteine lyase/cysteine desulfurase n=1 Tax=Actinorugispora endophytica TaxID=1605990 RepID=A0A4R6V0L0_9ACTN|nr:aminotransferase class V-fold PLP-dependent enzyme [Actinorugispora endophytica]TDQ51989.1 selenocysteine lyase/cysteine desulfurase [Actinorugispora endophytica]